MNPAPDPPVTRSRLAGVLHTAIPNQAVVSLGSLVVLVVAARGLPPGPFGLFASTQLAVLLLVGLANAAVSTGGIGLGVLVSALIVELLPAPRVLPYVAAFVLSATAFVGALLMPEPVKSRSRLRLTPQRAKVPPAVRPAFMLAALGVTSSWSIAGLFLALGPQLSAMS